MCNEELNVAKGADLLLKIILKDQAGSLINPTTLSKLVVFVNHVNGSLIAKYSKNTAVGFLPIDAPNPLLGEIQIKLLTAHTNAATEGKLVYEVHGVYTDATISDDGVLDLVSTNNYLCTIIKSVTSGIALP